MRKPSFVRRQSRGELLLDVEGLTGQGFSDISFQLRKGEILGFAGLVGAGRSEIMQTIFGFLPARKGQIKLEGRSWKQKDTNFSIKNGLFYLPEERKQQGILPLLSIRQNVGVTLVNSTCKHGVIKSKKERAIVQEIIQAYDIKTPSAEKQIMYLSGGNQQKAIIGRAMYGKPKVLIFDEPTKGIDVGTKNDIYQIMQRLASEEGVGIILVSSELEELMKCSNRIITIYEGRKVGEFEAEQAEKSTILNSMIGDSTKRDMERMP
ncbi:MAG TPA: ATP-binding cassette domain-containing protein [Bacillota bacterium]|nr:ATP-binding cassette domain-containing protein [Bacillota bacterium]